MMELDGDGETCLEKPLFIFAPDQEGIIEYAAVYPYSAVNAVLGQSRGANDHAVLQIVVLAVFSDLGSKNHIVTVKLNQIRGKGYIAGADFSFSVQDNGIHCKMIIADQLFAYGEGVKLFNTTGGFTNAPVHQHVEFKALSAAAAQQPGHIQGLEESDHGHGATGRRHPHAGIPED